MKIKEAFKKLDTYKMKVYVVWLDGEREFASDKWLEAKARYQQLENGFGEDRVDMTVEYI